MKTTLRRTAHLLLDLPVGIATFTIALTTNVLAAREIGRLERARAHALLGADVTSPPQARWRAFAYSLLMLPVGVVTSVVAITGWSTGIAALAYPAYAPFSDRTSVTVNDLTIGNAGWQIATSIAGALLLLAMPAIVRALSRLDTAMVRRFL